MIKSIGSLMAILGLAAIIFGFLDRVPTLLSWIYNWGEGAAWGIKIGLTVIGGILWFVGKNNQTVAESEEPASNNEEQSA